MFNSFNTIMEDINMNEVMTKIIGNDVTKMSDEEIMTALLVIINSADDDTHVTEEGLSELEDKIESIITIPNVSTLISNVSNMVTDNININTENIMKSIIKPILDMINSLNIQGIQLGVNGVYKIISMLIDAMDIDVMGYINNRLNNRPIKNDNVIQFKDFIKVEDNIDTDNIFDNIKDEIKSDNIIDDTVKSEPVLKTSVTSTNPFGLDTFEELYNRITKDVDNSLLGIKYSRHSIGTDGNSLFISGSTSRPNLVLIPLSNKRVKIQAFYGPIYIDGEEYPSIESDMNIGIPVIVRTFVKNGNGFGLKLKEDGTIAM